MRTLFLFSLTLLCSASAAQRVDTLSEAHATAFRSRSTAATPQYRLDSTALQRQGVTSLADALRRLPGVNLRDYGGAGGLKTISVRGMGAAHTQVILNGLPVSNAQQGAVDFSRYSLTDLHSLSLGIGDQPDLLCSARSLSAACVEMESHAFLPYSSEEITLIQSSWNAWHPQISATQKAGSHTLLHESAAYDYADNNYPYTFADERLHRFNSQLSSTRAQAGSRSTLRQGQLDSDLRYWWCHRHLPGPVIYYNPTAGTEQMREQEASASLRWRSTLPHSLQWQAAGRYCWQQSHYRNYSPTLTGPKRQNYDQQEAYATAGLSWQATAALGVAYVTDYTLQTLLSNLSTDNDIMRHSLLQALSLQYHHGGLHATLRVMDHYICDEVSSPTGHKPTASAPSIHRLTPSASVRYRLPHGITLRSHYKEFFRSPTFAENYYYHLGSTQLRPELTRQGGMGMTYSLHGQRWELSLSADGYLGSVRNRIVSVPINLFLWRTVNKDHVRTAGVDATALLSLHHRQHTVTLCGDYSLQHAQTENYQLPYTPRHSGAASLGWENPWVNTAISVTSAAQRSTTLTPSVPSTILPRYYEMSLSFWHRFVLRHGVQSLTLRGDLTNVTNQHYFVIARYPMPGLSYRITITYQL